MKKILTIGSVTADVLLDSVDALPASGRLQDVDSVAVLPGGCAVNAALDLKKLGAEVKLSCLVGQDVFGKMLMDHFEAAGLSLEGVISDPAVSTTLSVVLISSFGERSFLYHPGSAAAFCRRHVPAALLDEADVLFVAGQMLLPSFEGEELAAFFKEMKERGKMTVMDTAWDSSGRWLCRIEKALAYTDLFMPSFEEARALSGVEDPFEMADFFFDRGCGSVVIKLGKEGALLCKSREERTLVPIIEGVNVKDTTGAGDAFCAGFLMGVAKGWDYPRSGRFAAAVAASCIGETGASAGIKSYEETLLLAGLKEE